MLIVLFCLALFAGISGDLLKKTVNLRFGSEPAIRYLFMTIAFAVGTIVLCLMGDIQLHGVSTFTFVLAIVFGIFTAATTITHMLALNSGPYAYTAVIISLATLIPTFSGALFWNEQIFPIQFLGIFLMVLCFVMSVNPEESKRTQTSKWMFYCLLTFFLNGTISVMQKWHQNTVYKGELATFIMLAFASATVFSFVVALRLMKKEHCTQLSSFKWIYLALLAGIGFSLNNKICLYLSGAMDSAIYFPSFNVCALLLNTASGVFIFREKLSKRQLAGIIIGILSVLCLCNPFS